MHTARKITTLPPLHRHRRLRMTSQDTRNFNSNSNRSLRRRLTVRHKSGVMLLAIEQLLQVSPHGNAEGLNQPECTLRHHAQRLPTTTTTTQMHDIAAAAAVHLWLLHRRRLQQLLLCRHLKCAPLGNLLQGTFLLSHYIPKPPPSSPVAANATITIDLDLWNNYWGEFSEHFSAHDEAIQAALQLQNTASGQEMGAGQGKLNRRGVIVKFPSLSLDSFKSPVELQQHILRLATKFGVVEFCRVQHDEIRIQFTISSAAIEFASFARSLEASVMFPSHLLLHSNHSITHRSHPTAGGGVGGRVHVFLLDHRPPLAGAATASTQQYCTKLILGKRLDIPSMFLNALFRDLFEADHIEYQNGSFVVAFSSHSLCRYALHVLQQSFRQVFGLTLGYYDQKDVPALDLIG
jgi:hypothetical protein